MAGGRFELTVMVVVAAHYVVTLRWKPQHKGGVLSASHSFQTQSLKS